MKKRVYKILVNLGKITLLVNVLFVLSIVFQSLTIKGKVNYGDRCYLTLECISANQQYYFNELYDWLLKHHFDYRGLIEKGLALEAPKGIYEEE